MRSCSASAAAPRSAPPRARAVPNRFIILLPRAVLRRWRAARSRNQKGMAKMLNFVLVGCGRIGKRHAEILGRGQLKGAKLVAVCDTVETRARAYGDQYGVPFFLDYHRM